MTEATDNAALDARMLERESGAGVLARVEAFLQRFVAYPSSHAVVAHTLWIAHTHLMDLWDSTSRFALLSAERGSGKTRGLEITETLVPNPVHAVNVSPSYLFRKVGDAEDGAPTILFDEVDTLFDRRSQDTAELRGLLNAGHRRGAVTGRCVVVGKQVKTEEIPAYAAVALAGIGNLPDTIASRSIIINMRRRAPDEPVEPFRHRIHAKQAEPIRADLADWCNSIAEEIQNAEPAMPSSVQDRDADCWEPLLTIADAAGGDWPERARRAAEALVAGAAEQTITTGVQLLSDLRDVFGGADKLATETILKSLHELPESTWADIRGKPLNDRGLATRLRKYGIKPKVIRVGGSTPRGYLAQDLQDAWKRYLPSPSTKAQQAQHATGSATSNTAEYSQKLTVCGGVALVAPKSGNASDVADRDAIDERAAILEHEAGLSRVEAEAQAYREAKG